MSLPNLNQSISIIDPATMKIVGSVSTGQEQSHMFAISRDGRRAYTANVGPGTVSVLDLDGTESRYDYSGRRQIQRISLSVDDKLAFTSDVTKPQLAVIDTATNKVKTWIPLARAGLRIGAHARRKVAGHRSATGASGGVMDLSTMKVAHTIDLPARPQEVLVSPDNKVAYVSCDQSAKVAVINLSDWTVKKSLTQALARMDLRWRLPRKASEYQIKTTKPESRKRNGRNHQDESDVRTHWLA